jgi:hypothetical protein
MEVSNLSWEAGYSDSKMRLFSPPGRRIVLQNLCESAQNGCEDSASRLYASWDGGMEDGLRKAAGWSSAKGERELEHHNSTTLKLLCHRRTTSISRSNYKADWGRLHERYGNDVALEMSSRRVAVVRTRMCSHWSARSIATRQTHSHLYWTTPDSRSHHSGVRVSLTSSQVDCRWRPCFETYMLSTFGRIFMTMSLPELLEAVKHR